MGQLEEWCEKLYVLALRVRSKYGSVLATLKEAGDETLRGREKQSEDLCVGLNGLTPIPALVMTAYQEVAELVRWLTDYEPLVEQHGVGLQGAVFKSSLKTLHAELKKIWEAIAPAKPAKPAVA